MDSPDTQPLHVLNDDELGRLASIALEEYGPNLARPQFTDVMLGLFENIAGLETLTRKHQQRYLIVLWFKYQQAVLANQSRH